MVWKQDIQEKAEKPEILLRIEPLQFNFGKQVMPIPFNIDITFKCKF